MVDLRSDTFTKPGPGMLNYMFQAKVGDDVFNEDPTVNLLEQMVSEQFGKEASLFCPSGTMTNQIAIKCHTQPGEEVICDKTSHIYSYEGGGIAFNSGCQVRPLEGERGMISVQQIRENVNPDDIHKPPSRLVSIENTANRGGGACYSLEDIEAIHTLCIEMNLAFHLDGARLFNAMVANGTAPLDYGKNFDSISICFSKGMGAPAGSVLIGSSHFISKARRIRKLLGGGMRQAGYLAAACIYALENNIFRLKEDHYHAKEIAAALIKKGFIGRILPVETNIIIFEVLEGYTPSGFCEFLSKHEILCLPISPTQVRIVTHLDISESMVKKVLSTLELM